VGVHDDALDVRFFPVALGPARRRLGRDGRRGEKKQEGRDSVFHTARLPQEAARGSRPRPDARRTDGRSWAYSYSRVLLDLYVVERLK
jgi:hypothetical protein